MPHCMPTRGALRWGVLLLMLGLAWLVSPHLVPLYDGIGFPDEPYRYVPARSGAPAATVAEVSLAVAGGVNTGGLIANSKETGPQVSVYAPPRAFAAPGTAPVVVRASPVPTRPPLPAGRVDSNVYLLTFTSAAGPVQLVPEAQSPAITMRSVSSAPAEPVLAYRRTPSSSWTWLPTRRIGHDLSNATAQGPGEYVLVLRSKAKVGGHAALVLGIAAVLVLMLAVVLGVRWASRRAARG